jgi:hypothetical protein
MSKPPPVRQLDARASTHPKASQSETLILDALRVHREALREGDVEAVRATMAWGARPPWERDLLLDLSAAEGLPEAVARMRKFWMRAKPLETRGVRLLSNDDAEVYESIEMPDGQKLSTVTLMRFKGDRYLVVAFAQADDDTVRLLILSDDPDPELDDVRFSREWIQRFGATAELILDGDDGALGHPDREWLGRVRGPIPWEPIRERLSRPSLRLPEATCALEIAMAPPQARAERFDALQWLGRAAGELAAQIESSWIYVQRAEKLVAVADMRKALAVSSRARGLASSFIRLVVKDGWAATRGLGQLRLPEVEIELGEWSDAQAARRLVGTFAVGFIDGRVPPSSSEHVINVGGFRCRLAPGRRGSDKGHSYGIYGALAVRPAEDARTNESGERISLFDDLSDGGSG